MNRKIVNTIASGIFALVIALSPLCPARAQDSGPSYERMAPIDQYLMADGNTEIAFARTAAPRVHLTRCRGLGPRAPRLRNCGQRQERLGVPCGAIVDGPVRRPEFLNPDQRLPLCLNPPAVRTHMPLTFKTTELAMAGLSKTQMFDSIKAAYDKKELPLPEPGAMCYMTSKQQYFSRKVGNADPHLMFWFPKTDDMFWGAGLPGSPVYVHQYSPEPITEFIISVSKWSDGTTAPTD